LHFSGNGAGAFLSAEDNMDPAAYMGVDHGADYSLVPSLKGTHSSLASRPGTYVPGYVLGFFTAGLRTP
jgi:hypothetical protein